jgi:ribosome-associated protein
VKGGVAIEALEITRAAAEILESKKGADVTAWDLRGLSEVTDYTIAVTGTSAPHVKALANEVESALKDRGVRVYRRSGSPDCGWVVLDYVELVIHIFLRDPREYYAIEMLWAPAPRVALPPPAPRRPPGPP